MREKGLINEKQTRRQLHINEDQWVDLLAWGIERGMLEELSVVLGQMTYGFVKPRAATTGRRSKQTPVERTVLGVGADSPKRGTPDHVTVRAARPKGPAESAGARRAQARAGRTHKGRRGAK